METVGPFLKETQGSQYILAITDHHSKLAWVISTAKTVATHSANLYMDPWLVTYGLPTYLLAESGTQFVSKFFAAVCALPAGKHLPPAAYYSQIND